MYATRNYAQERERDESDHRIRCLATRLEDVADLTQQHFLLAGRRGRGRNLLGLHHHTVQAADDQEQHEGIATRSFDRH